MDEKRREAGQKLLDAAVEFFDACRAEGQDGSVQWLQGSGGELVIFTQGMYRERLMLNVHNLPGSVVHRFGERMPDEEE